MTSKKSDSVKTVSSAAGMGETGEAAVAWMSAGGDADILVGGGVAEEGGGAGGDAVDDGGGAGIGAGEADGEAVLRGRDCGDEGGATGGAGGGERELIGGGAAEADAIGGAIQDGDERGHGGVVDGEGAEGGGARGAGGFGVEEEECAQRGVFLREVEFAHGIGGAAGEDHVGQAESRDEGLLYPGGYDGRKGAAGEAGDGGELLGAGAAVREGITSSMAARRSARICCTAWRANSPARGQANFVRSR